MRLLGLAVLGFILPAVSGCHGFLDNGCKNLKLVTVGSPKQLRLEADCPGGDARTPSMPLDHQIRHENGHLTWRNPMDNKANIHDCSDFKVENGYFSASCDGKRTDSIDLNRHIALIDHGGMCGDYHCC